MLGLDAGHGLRDPSLGPRRDDGTLAQRVSGARETQVLPVLLEPHFRPIGGLKNVRHLWRDADEMQPRLVQRYVLRGVQKEKAMREVGESFLGLHLLAKSSR